LLVSLPVSAADATKDKGLLISPIRDYVTIDANDTKMRAVTVANMTDKPIVVTMSLEQFSVDDYAYDFHFSPPSNNYVHLVENRIELKPYQSHQVPYVITTPKNAAPGGMYYTFFASADLTSGTLNGTVKAASLLYLTVSGNLIQTGDIIKASTPWLEVTPQVPYTIDVKNTGNSHYFAHFTGSVAGAFYSSAPTGTSQLLMPQKIRRVSGTVPAPLLPGVYKLNYGYNTDSGATVSKSSYFLFLPPWFIVVLLLAGYVFGKQHLARLRAGKPRIQPDEPTHS
jgi:hypothetical protein